MAIRANPKLIDELEIYGAQDVSKCYHCGNCSAACPFSKEPYIFPRRSMRSLQMGLEAKLESDLEPWLCYYCGECSDECPRDAEPGETMMSLRRWLTARYDLTGISRLFYRSWKLELLAILIVGAPDGHRLPGLRVHARQHPRLRRRRRLPAGVERPHLRLDAGRRAARPAPQQLRPHVVVHHRARQGRAPAR